MFAHFVLLLGAFILLYDYFRRHELRRIPGPLSFALTRLRLAYEAWNAHSTRTVHKLHQRYGSVVRIGPNQVSFNSLSALRQIYGAGSGFERTSFYRIFDVYGRPNLFTFKSGNDHRERKKLMSHMYSNQSVLGRHFSDLVKRKVSGYLQMLENEPTAAAEIFSSLHYFSIDAISEFVYGPSYGGTQALRQFSTDRRLLDDILCNTRRKLSWFATHFPAYTKWITTRTGILDRLITRIGLLPMPRPFVYSGIREHALKAFWSFKTASPDDQEKLSETTIIGKLVQMQKDHALSDMDIASECADHLLAGIDTTADSLLFLFWALSLPQNLHCQERLRDELSRIEADDQGISAPKDLVPLPYLSAVIRETLRLYSPLPAFEPRSCPTATVIDGYAVPAHTIVGLSPYSQHREPAIFPAPLRFDPTRWLTDDDGGGCGGGGGLIPDADARNRWFWPFSRGARMCLGRHLAHAEMATLAAAVVRRYHTRARHPAASPAVTSRFEIVRDESVRDVRHHECWIDFVPLHPSPGPPDPTR